MTNCKQDAKLNCNCLQVKYMQCFRLHVGCCTRNTLRLFKKQEVKIPKDVKIC